MLRHPYRLLIPNSLTFLSLLCGTASILCAASATPAEAALVSLWWAGVLILVSYILDLADGLAARMLHASSAFGLQLDSLVDMVSLGMAPAVLVFVHLSRVAGLSPRLSGACVALVPLAGAFRLARFNLLPPKTTSSADSMGLTISTSGALLALAVLSDPAQLAPLQAASIYISLLLGVSLLMSSTIAFPPLTWLVSTWSRTVMVGAMVGVSLWLLPFFTAWFLWTLTYIGIGMARACYRRFT